jgi:hypothetical protein
MKGDATPVWVATGLVGLWIALTWSYAGYKGQETDSVADRLQNSGHVSARV